ncbi:hypothetical protein RHSIM_Rhsim10G0151800 [Rhododendron simsii]|uniref:DUF309 domain-containing protein n=1 Tax=Rhododendron simsii TaxID=118357 RepID=A0A834GBE7_RHOSS|nr:hypothetical protein RHSIM_Rhsim10G0151800 [Rhododendron simsii]
MVNMDWTTGGATSALVAWLVDHGASKCPILSASASSSSSIAAAASDSVRPSFNEFFSIRENDSANEEEDDHEVARSGSGGASFSEAVELFNGGDYYKCHDVLESLWNDAEDPARTLIHGVLQCAVGFHHLFNKNHKGAMMELGEGLCKLRKMNFKGGPFLRFEQEISAVLDFIYQTHKCPILSASASSSSSIAAAASDSVRPSFNEFFSIRENDSANEEEDDHEVARSSSGGASFSEAVELFNGGDYYKCHDVLESLWNDAEDPARTLIHGVLQCAVGFHHLFNKNHKGAMMELGEGLCKLRKMNFKGGPFLRFEQEISAVLDFIYQTQLEFAACGGLCGRRWCGGVSGCCNSGGDLRRRWCVLVDDNGGKRMRLGISYVSFLKLFVRSKSAVPWQSFLGFGLLWGLRRRGPPAVVLSSSASCHGGGGLVVRLLVEEVGGCWVEAVTELFGFGRDLRLSFGVHGLGLARTFLSQITNDFRSWLYLVWLVSETGTDGFCHALDQSEKSYQLLGGYAAGQLLYCLEIGTSGTRYIVFCPKRSSETGEPPRVKLPTLHASVQHLKEVEYYGIN